jgi:hypothetical protein
MTLFCFYSVTMSEIFQSLPLKWRKPTLCAYTFTYTAVIRLLCVRVLYRLLQFFCQLLVTCRAWNTYRHAWHEWNHRDATERSIHSRKRWKGILCSRKIHLMITSSEHLNSYQPVSMAVKK